MEEDLGEMELLGFVRDNKGLWGKAVLTENTSAILIQWVTEREPLFAFEG